MVEVKNTGQEEVGRLLQNKAHLHPAQVAPGQPGFSNPEHYISGTEYLGFGQPCGLFPLDALMLWVILVNVSICEPRLEIEALTQEAAIILG